MNIEKYYKEIADKREQYMRHNCIHLNPIDDIKVRGAYFAGADAGLAIVHEEIRKMTKELERLHAYEDRRTG